MTKHSKEFDKLYYELSKFNTQIDKNYPLEVWLKRTQSLNTLIQKNSSLLPEETKKEQQEISALYRQLKQFQKRPEEQQAEGGIYVFVAVLSMILLFSFLYIVWAVILSISLSFFIAFLLWKRTQNTQKKIKTKILSIERDVRYLSRIIEHEKLK